MSIIAASVVDLPEPVGPVTSTNPRGLRMKSSSTGGRPRSASFGMTVGIVRITAPIEARWKKAFTRKRALPGTEYERSICQSVSSRLRCSLLRIE
jgi:hypothetical protein